jgi:hypothetical protein
MGRQNSTAAQNLTALIIRELRKYDDITESPSPNYLIRNWPPAFQAWSTRQVRDAFFASPQFPGYSVETPSSDTIARGVSNGILAYVGKSDSGEYEPFYYKTAIGEADIEIADDMYIITGDAAEEVVKKPVLTSLAIDPNHIQLRPNTPFQFLVRGFDQHGHPMGIDDGVWSATGGHVDQTGQFHGTSSIGTYAVTASTKGLTATATVDVLAEGVPGPVLEKLVIVPAECELKSRRTIPVPGERL